MKKHWVFLSLLAVLAGCAPTAKQPVTKGPWVPRMTNPPMREFPRCADKNILELEDDDVIVAVDGDALTKGDFALALERYRWSLLENRMMKQKEFDMRYKKYGRSYIDEFVSGRMLLHAARNQHLITEADLRTRVENGVKFSSRKFRYPSAVLDKRMPGGLAGLRRSLEELCWIGDYLATNVYPFAQQADDMMVSNVYAEIEAENKDIQATNALSRASLEAIRRRIVDGHEDFGVLSEKYDQNDGMRLGTNGYWRTSRPDIEKDELFVKKIFTLPPGGVSDVLEDEEGYFIVKVLDIATLPVPTNAPAAFKPKVEYELGRIWMPKEELVQPAAAPKEMKNELNATFRREALAKHLEQLAKNVRIDYPYGTNFWTSAKKKLSTAERKAMRRAKKVQKAMDRGEDVKAFVEGMDGKSGKAKAAKGKKHGKSHPKKAKQSSNGNRQNKEVKNGKEVK